MAKACKNVMVDGKTDEWYKYDFYDDDSLKRKVCLREA